MTFTFLRLQTLRSIINSHAVLSSLMEQIVYEVSAKQLEIFSTIDVQKDMDTSHLTGESAAIVLLLFSAGMMYVYDTKLQKLQSIGDYIQVKKRIRTAMFIFVFIFLRNVENAI